MEFTLPERLVDELNAFRDFPIDELHPHLSTWYRQGAIPRRFYEAMGTAGWFGFDFRDDRMVKRSGFRETLVTEALAAVSSGVAVTTLVHSDLGMLGLYLFGSDMQQARYGEAAVSGKTLDKQENKTIISKRFPSNPCVNAWWNRSTGISRPLVSSRDKETVFVGSGSMSVRVSSIGRSSVHGVPAHIHISHLTHICQ